METQTEKSTLQSVADNVKPPRRPLLYGDRARPGSVLSRRVVLPEYEAAWNAGAYDNLHLSELISEMRGV